mgnify:CR=1 FL=1
MKKIYIALVLLLGLSSLFAQSSQTPVTVKKINTPIKIDGNLDEAIWSTLQATQSFHQYFPTDSAQIKQDTEVYMAFDDGVGIINFWFAVQY